MTKDTTPLTGSTPAVTPTADSAPAEATAATATAVLPPAADLSTATTTVIPPAAPAYSAGATESAPPAGGFGAPAGAAPPVAPQLVAPQPSAVPQPTAAYPYRRTNTLGIVTLVLGILGFGLVPVITGHIALSQIKKRAEDGYGITLAGLILGYVTLAGWLLVLLFWIGAAGLAIFGALLGSAA